MRKYNHTETNSWPFRESSNTVLLSEQTVAWRSLQRCRARLL